MEHRLLGNTGLQLPVLSFGASSLGAEFREIDLNEALKSVRVALDLGMNFIDTSPFYGRGMSEVLLGYALNGVRATAICWGRNSGATRERISISPPGAWSRASTVSLSAWASIISTSCSVTTSNSSTCADRRRNLPAMRKIQQQGKVRFVGISGYPMKIFKYVLDRAPLDVILSYNHYTLQNTHARRPGSLSEGKGVGIMNAAPFAARLLTNSDASGLAQGHAAGSRTSPEGRRALCRKREPTSPSSPCSFHPSTRI
jgi:L-galactose dehydrogenase